MTIHQGSIGAGSAGSDTTAIHKNIANEISTITDKTAVVGADIAIIEDSEASGVKKKMALSSLGSIYEPKLPETPENPSNKFLNGNKDWATVPIGAGGFSAPLYFSNEDSDVVGYKKISYANDVDLTELSASITNQELLLRTYLYDDVLGLTVIDAGLWVSSFRVKVDKAIGVTQIKLEAFVRHSDNTETTLFSDYSQELNNLDYVIIRKDSPQPVFSVAATDRLGIRIYGKTTSTAAVTIYTTIGDGDASYFTTPIPFRHSLFRGLDYESSGHTGFQAELVSGENLKTINNESILGTGNIEISGGSGVVDNETLTGEGTNENPFKISEEYQRRINAGI